MMDYTTWHDQEPSHPMKSDILTELWLAMNDAWKMYDQVVDGWIDYQSGMSKVVVTDQDKQDALDKAVAAQQAYYTAYAKENAEYCSCKPDDNLACDVCTAFARRNSDIRYEEQ